jgi:Flp pilus assembly protein TadG
MTTKTQSKIVQPVSRVRRARQKGSAMVEAALLGIIFFSMLVATFDFGQFLFIHQALVERARSAARWGLVNGGTDLDGTKNMVLYNQSTTGQTAFFGLTASNVTVTTSDLNTDNARLTVNVDNYSYKMISPYIAGNYTGPGIRVSVPLGMFN